MMTIIFFLILMGCLLLISTSQKAIVSNSFSLEEKIYKQPKVFKALGCCVLLIALFICFVKFGVTSGTLFWLVILPIVLSLVIVLRPLKIINYKGLLLLLVVLLIIEILFL